VIQAASLFCFDIFLYAMSAHKGITTEDKNGLTVQEGGYVHMASIKGTREWVETMNESGVTVEADPQPYILQALEISGVGRPDFGAVVAASVNPGSLLIHTVKEGETHNGKSTFSEQAERYDNDEE